MKYLSQEIKYIKRQISFISVFNQLDAQIFVLQ